MVYNLEGHSDSEIKRLLVRTSLEALCCVFEQDTLVSTKNWFKFQPRKHPNMTEKMLTGMKRININF